MPLPNSFHLPCATSGSRLSRNKSIGTFINFPEHPTTNLNHKLTNRILDESLSNQINILSNTSNLQQFLNTEYVCMYVCVCVCVRAFVWLIDCRYLLKFIFLWNINSDLFHPVNSVICTYRKYHILSSYLYTANVCTFEFSIDEQISVVQSLITENIYLNFIASMKEIKPKQKFLSPIKYYDKYSTLNISYVICILFIFHTYKPLIYLQKESAV